MVTGQQHGSLEVQPAPGKPSKTVPWVLGCLRAGRLHQASVVPLGAAPPFWLVPAQRPAPATTSSSQESAVPAVQVASPRDIVQAAKQLNEEDRRQVLAASDAGVVLPGGAQAASRGGKGGFSKQPSGKGAGRGQAGGGSGRVRGRSGAGTGCGRRSRQALPKPVQPRQEHPPPGTWHPGFESCGGITHINAMASSSAPPLAAVVAGGPEAKTDVRLGPDFQAELPALRPRPAAPATAGGALPPLAVLLLHGAGGDLTTGHLPAIAAACAAAGLPCLRFTCRGGNLQHRIDVCKAVLAQASSLPGLAGVQRWVLAGHSMGARVAAAVANDAPAATAAMLFSYPLHPPGKPQQLRDALLKELHVPTLLVRGDRDPFSQQAQWDAAVGGMAPDVCRQQHSVWGGDHSLRVARGGSEAALQAVCAAVGQFLAGLQQRQEQQQEPGGAGGSSAAAASKHGTGSAAEIAAAGKRKAAQAAQPAAAREGAPAPPVRRQRHR